ncbi:MAG: hypothetical protein DI630_12495 [Gordonia sp. (in: high G+C Gram-positive bacteria)]|nr:MAG: hypothetical protein DI630_12495 [Gordonia sp. (in: high G+C Gram-positive bacteria)]
MQPEINPSDPLEQPNVKRDKPVMVYLTPSERDAFKAWAFERETAMSKVLYEGIVALLSGPCPDQSADGLGLPCAQVNGAPESGWDQLRVQADEFKAIAADLAQKLWDALEEGAQLTDLTTEVGLSTEQIRQLLAPNSVPQEVRGVQNLERQG